MKTIILCGGLGTRLGEETTVIPKPMVDVGDRPILWHIMKIYDHYGFRDFVLALGYKSSVIKHYFLNYHANMSNITVSLASGDVQYTTSDAEDWTVQLVDTGRRSLTGGRLRRLIDVVDGQTFMLTYGDGVADIDISALVAFHRRQGRIATVTAVRPAARFGNIVVEDDMVTEFQEKPQTGEGWINGGFFVFEPAVFNYLRGDDDVLEAHPLETLTAEGQLAAYRHPGFWQCMDTPRDRLYLEEAWNAPSPPWKIW